MSNVIEIFIDETMPHYKNKPGKGPIIHFGRAFLIRDLQKWIGVKNILNSEGVWDWHDKDMLRSENFLAIVDGLSSAKKTTQGFLSVKCVDDWLDIAKSGFLVELKKKYEKNQFFIDFPWREERPEAVALFSFIDQIIQTTLSRGLHPRIVFDLAKDNFESRVFDSIEYKKNGIIRGEYGRFSILGVSKKKRSSTNLNSVHWINLVDG